MLNIKLLVLLECLVFGMASQASDRSMAGSVAISDDLLDSKWNDAVTSGISETGTALSGSKSTLAAHQQSLQLMPYVDQPSLTRLLLNVPATSPVYQPVYQAAQFGCPAEDCQHKAVSRYALAKHVAQHSMNAYQCGVDGAGCDREFLTLDDCMQHRQREHQAQFRAVPTKTVVSPINPVRARVAGASPAPRSAALAEDSKQASMKTEVAEAKAVLISSLPDLNDAKWFVCVTDGCGLFYQSKRYLVDHFNNSHAQSDVFKFIKSGQIGQCVYCDTRLQARPVTRHASVCANKETPSRFQVWLDKNHGAVIEVSNLSKPQKRKRG